MASQGFFDTFEKLKGRKAQPAPAEGQQGKIVPLSVSQLTSQIDRAIRAGFPNAVHVKGECSNYNQNRASGHRYFSLKDEFACLQCVMWKSDGERLKFDVTDGMELIASGRLVVYPARGQHQLVVSSLQPVGQGALELAFRQLCAKLEAEGLFKQERKKKLPRYPMRIAIVSSREGAALQDMLKVLRRFPWVRLMIYPVPVQGDGAAEKIAEGLRQLNRCAEQIGGIDLILLGRGGGSLEDLWEFNEEVVARAIVASKIPVVTGIGHEVDTSIADLVADYHAHTPTEAAQVVMSQWRIVKEAVDTSGARMTRALRTCVQDARHRLRAIERHDIFRRPMDRIHQLRQRLDDRQRSLTLAVSTRLRRVSERLARGEALLRQCHPRHAVKLNAQKLTQLETRLWRSARQDQRRRLERLEAIFGRLRALGPEQVLKRGYTITMLKKGGEVVRSAAQLKGGERLVTRFADGKVESVAEDPQQLPLFE